MKKTVLICGRALGFVVGAMSANVNASLFFIGLVVVCASVSRWSGPLAGVVGGGALMSVAAWPFVIWRKG